MSLSRSSAARTLQDLLKTLSAKKRSKRVNLGQVICLGLEGLRKDLGEAHWEKSKHLVGRLIEKAIGSVCDDGDTYTRCRDGSFVIVFETENLSVAEAQAAKIAQIVNQALFGEAETDGLTVHATVTTTDGLALGEGRSADEILQDLVQQGVKRSVVAPDAGQADGGARDHGSTEPPSSDQEAPHGVSQEEATSIPRCRDALFAEFDKIKVQSPITFRFAPCWSVKYNKIAIFSCKPMRSDPIGGLETENYAVLGTEPDSKDIAELDVGALEHGMLALCQNLKAGARQRLTANVHFETLASSHGRGLLIDLLREAPAPVRQLLSIRLYDIPDGIPPDRLSEMTGRLSNYISSFVAVVRLQPTRDTHAKLSLLKSAGVQNAFIQRPDGSLDEALSRMKNFSDLCGTLGLIPGAFGIESHKLALEAAYAGFGLITGPVLGGPFERLPKPYDFGIPELEAGSTQSVA